MSIDSNLYNFLKENLSRENRYHIINMIDTNVNHASNVLELVRDTFPTYTLHNKVHCLNVIRKIEMILGDKISFLSDMEITLLILSAFYHDIGMVYSEDFKKNLPNHPLFEVFLEEHPDLALSYYQTYVIDDNIIESFCRIYHAQNSYDYIMSMDEKMFFWQNNISLRNQVALLCKSHCFSISELNSEDFDTDYVYQADLKFCALMLRLGDVLDFDYTRTPVEIYEHLKLYRSLTVAQKTSDIEWQKHLSSNGLFCDEKRKIWNIVAVPQTAKHLHDILAFIRYIEDELLGVNNALKSCSAKKQLISFPLNIDRTKIKNKDFIYGDFRFSISNDNLLNLFMGKNLYINNYTFIRELIQNAIDTTVQRTTIEESCLTEQKIKICTYNDSGYQSIFCIEDFGMGMDLDIIQSYLLKIGSSYYESDRFKALMAKSNKRMTAIGRFGIGLLSCFLISSEVKIYTRYYQTGITYEIVLDSLNSFFTIREIHPKSKEYLEHFGSKIIVNIAPSKEEVDFNYEQYIKSITLHSKVNIQYNDISIEQNNDVVDFSWGEYHEEDLSYYKKSILQTLKKEHIPVEKMKLKILPIDITKYSNNKNLRGEGIICEIEIDNLDKILEYTHSEFEKRMLGIRFDSGKIALFYTLDVDIERLQEDQRRLLYQINNINNNINKHEKKFKSVITDINIKDIYQTQNGIFDSLCDEYFINYELIEYYSENYDKISTSSQYVYFFDEKARNAFAKISRKQSALLSHNGVLINQNSCQYISNTYFVIMCLALENDLRPVLGLSRAELIAQPWEFYVSYHYSIYNALRSNSWNINNYRLPFDELKLECLEYGYLSKSIFESFDGWKSIPLFMIDGKMLPLDKLPTNKYIDINLQDLKSYYSKVKFIDVVKSILMQKYYDIIVDLHSRNVMLKRKSKDPIKALLEESSFPPLFFIEYSQKNVLKMYGKPLNARHKFAKWLILNSNYLNEKYSELFNQIVRILIDDSGAFRVKKINQILTRILNLDQERKLSEIPTIFDSDFI